MSSRAHTFWIKEAKTHGRSSFCTSLFISVCPAPRFCFWIFSQISKIHRPQTPTKTFTAALGELLHCSIATGRPEDVKKMYWALSQFVALANESTIAAAAWLQSDVWAVPMLCNNYSVWFSKNNGHCKKPMHVIAALHMTLRMFLLFDGEDVRIHAAGNVHNGCIISSLSDKCLIANNMKCSHRCCNGAQLGQSRLQWYDGLYAYSVWYYVASACNNHNKNQLELKQFNYSVVTYVRT